MQARILLTGVTGAVGSALLPELLAQGFEVYCLIRPRGGLSPAERLCRVLDHPRAIAVAGDVTQPLCGVDPASLPSIDKFVHAAADTSLTQNCAPSVLNANLSGTRHALDLAAALGNAEFHYIGTAYIAGDARSLAEHEPGVSLLIGQPRNPYEASKQEAERTVRASRGAISAYRPSIVIGRSDDGSAHMLEGIYDIFKSAWRLHSLVCSGGYTDNNGIRLCWRYPLTISIGIKGLFEQTLNLIQIDWHSRTLARLIALPARGRTYNLVHPDPITVGDLLKFVFEALDINNVELVEKGKLSLSPMTMALNRAVNREVDRFRPYLASSPQFANSNVYQDLGSDWPRPAAITREFVQMTMRRAREGWLKEQDQAGALEPGGLAVRPSTGAEIIPPTSSAQTLVD